MLVVGVLLRPTMCAMVGGRLRGWERSFAAFPVFQFVLFALFSYYGFANLYDRPEFYGVLAVLGVMFCVVDVLLFSATRSYETALEQDQRASVLAERLDACLAEYGSAVTQVERAAALRHDLRNHLQVAGTLVERGELVRAREYVVEIAKEVRG